MIRNARNVNIVFGVKMKNNSIQKLENSIADLKKRKAELMDRKYNCAPLPDDAKMLNDIDVMIYVYEKEMQKIKKYMMIQNYH